MAERTGPTSVYRYYDRFNMLIYVGITKRHGRRNDEHNASAEWWPFVERQEIDHCGTRREAESHERELITKYRPPFNTVHNRDAVTMRTAYLDWRRSGAAEIHPQQLLAQVNGVLPLVPLFYSRTKLILRTQLEHGVVARLLRHRPGPMACTTGRIEQIRAIKVHGPFALIRITGWGIPEISGAAARVRNISSKPLEFRISAVTFVKAQDPLAGTDAAARTVLGSDYDLDLADALDCHPIAGEPEHLGARLVPPKIRDPHALPYNGPGGCRNSDTAAGAP